jgi:hypothetical protein
MAELTNVDLLGELAADRGVQALRPAKPSARQGPTPVVRSERALPEQHVKRPLAHVQNRSQHLVLSREDLVLSSDHLVLSSERLVLRGQRLVLSSVRWPAHTRNAIVSSAVID